MAFEIHINWTAIRVDILLIQSEEKESDKLGYLVFKVLSTYDIDLSRVAMVPVTEGRDFTHKWEKGLFFVFGSPSYAGCRARMNLCQKALHHLELYVSKLFHQEEHHPVYRELLTIGMEYPDIEINDMIDDLRLSTQRLAKYDPEFGTEERGTQIVPRLTGICMQVVVMLTLYQDKFTVLPSSLKDLEKMLRENYDCGHDDLLQVRGKALLKVYHNRYKHIEGLNRTILDPILSIGRQLDYCLGVFRLTRIGNNE